MEKILNFMKMVKTILVPFFLASPLAGVIANIYLRLLCLLHSSIFFFVTLNLIVRFDSTVQFYILYNKMLNLSYYDPSVSFVRVRIIDQRYLFFYFFFITLIYYTWLNFYAFYLWLLIIYKIYITTNSELHFIHYTIL